MRLPFRLVPALSVAVAILAAPSARPYEVVLRDGSSHAVRTLAVVRDGVRLVPESYVAGGDQRALTVSRDDIDFYETFRRNLEGQAGNLVVFTTGAQLRFDSLDVKDGFATFRVSDKGTCTLPESLVDYEASVLEGATLRLPRGAGAGLGVAKPAAGGGGWSDPASAADAGDYNPDGAAPSRSRRVGRGPTPSSRRGSPITPLSGSEASTDEAQPEVVPMLDDQAPPEIIGGEGGEPIPGASSPGDGESEPTGRFGSKKPGRNPGPGGAGTGQIFVSLSADQTVDNVQAIQVSLSYPASCTPVLQGLAFTGFASQLPIQPGPPGANPLTIAGVSFNIGQTVGGSGEFLRIPFVWHGSQPDASQFIVSVNAQDPTPSPISFATRVAVN